MNNGWTIGQTKRLFETVRENYRDFLGLSVSFRVIAEEYGKSVNSVRNYYYSQLKMFQMLPRLADELGIEVVKCSRASFDLFTSEQIEQIITLVLCERVSGKSVRRILQEYSGGNPSQSLRLMNKYRSMVSNHRDRVEQIMKKLAAAKTPFVNPYTNATVRDSAELPSSTDKLVELMKKLEKEDAASFISMLLKLVN